MSLNTDSHKGIAFTIGSEKWAFHYWIWLTSFCVHSWLQNSSVRAENMKNFPNSCDGDFQALSYGSLKSIVSKNAEQNEIILHYAVSQDVSF